MTALDLLSQLRDLDVRLWVEDGRLHYSAASGALTPDLRAEIAGHKAEILTLLPDLAAPTLCPRPRTGPIPLSFAQQRLWFLDQLVPASPFYTIAGVIRFELDLDISALERALNEIVRRHESLRTTFAAPDGEPEQVIAPALHLPLPVADLRSVPERETEADRLATEEARRPFDLARGPLVRTSLLRLDDADYWFLLTMHHIVSDGWSMDVFFDELSRLYSCYTRGQQSPLDELSIQYADFAIWQREWLRGEVYRRQLAYWRARLNDLPALDLPTDRPRPAALSYRGTTQPIALSAPLSRQLRALAERESATLFMTLFAAFVVLLHRYSGLDDIVVGAPIANRNRAEIEPLIGFFVNSLVLRADTSGDPAFRELLHRIRDTALEAYAHQDLPFEKLVEELHPQRDLSRNPLFQVTFQLQHGRASAEPAPKAPPRISRGTAIFDLAFRLWDTGGAIDGGFEYSTDLFDTCTVERMAGHFQVLLDAVVANPDCVISRLPLLTSAERRQFTIWNRTRRDYPDVCLHQPFESQAARTPDAVAVVSGETIWTYRELNERASRIADSVSETRVAVSMERSPEMVAAFLGILKAGAAYVPVDPSYPGDRVSFMLADSVGQALPPARHISAHNPAYVLYTSGSLGKPKGVVVPHRAIANHMFWMLETFPLTPADKVLQKTPVSFDASVWEFYAPLWAGAQLVLARPDGHRDPRYLAQEIQRHGITVLQVVPSLLRLLLDEPEFGNCRSLRHVFCGGEALTADLAARFHSTLPASLHNLYGPTEATIDATSWTCRPGESRTVVPIGRPISNVQAHVLDRHLELVPVGVPGELYLGGAGVAVGYLNQPALTAERFVPDPFATSGRLYRTGDRARYLGNGTLEFLGRIDQQMKLRGYRIEPGEIETVLEQHPRVRQAAVLVREDGPGGDRRLVAYIARQPAGTESESVSDRLDRWKQVHDSIHQRSPTAADPTLNFAGWNSSYTGLPIPEAEMREWLDESVARVLALHPRRVLEIGCGSGLLLFRIARRCDSYHGTDFSPAALDYARRHVERLGLDNVRLSECAADDLTSFAPGSFDTVILNSVVQYFPSAEYLVRVLTSAARLLAPGGAIFLGDLRSLPLLEAFHTSVELERAPAGTTAEELRRRIQKRVADEQELVIDPRFFHSLGCSATVSFKPCRSRNELTLFRYDVVLRGQPVGSSDTAQYVNNSLDTTASRGFEADVRDHLHNRLPEYMLPSAYVVVDSFPVLPNGKIDRAALPAPDTARPQTANPIILPRSPAEEQLARIWVDLLGLEQVGVEDDFFADLGGHSLLATQLVSRIRNAFQVDLPLASVFQAPTISGLALALLQHQAGSAGDDQLAGMIAELEALPENAARDLLDTRAIDG